MKRHIPQSNRATRGSGPRAAHSSETAAVEFMRWDGRPDFEQRQLIAKSRWLLAINHGPEACSPLQIADLDWWPNPRSHRGWPRIRCAKKDKTGIPAYAAESDGGPGVSSDRPLMTGRPGPRAEAGTTNVIRQISVCLRVYAFPRPDSRPGANPHLSAPGGPRSLVNNDEDLDE